MWIYTCYAYSDFPPKHVVLIQIRAADILIRLIAEFKLNFMYATINAGEGLNSECVCNVLLSFKPTPVRWWRSVAQLVIREKKHRSNAAWYMLPDSQR